MLRFFIILILILVLAFLFFLGYVYFNRQSILDSSIDSILKSSLPDYIELDSLKVDMQMNAITAEGFRIRNPLGFKRPYLLSVSRITCAYLPLDANNILKGIAISDIELIGPEIFLERNIKGKLNTQLMDEVFSRPAAKPKTGIQAKALGLLAYVASPVKDISRFLSVDADMLLSKGSIFIDDYYISQNGYYTVIGGINGIMKPALREDFKGIDYLVFRAAGLLNSAPGEAVSWDIEYDPKAERLTMASTFNISHIDFTHFEPYYDIYSPFIFEKGNASGRIIANFDNGSIGSTNEIIFSELSIVQKKDHSFNRFWPTGTEDLYRYFSSESGDIVFDFTVKGDIENPKFYLGSKTKRALTYMFVDKIAGHIFKTDSDDAHSEGADAPQTGSQEAPSAIDKVLDILRNF
jgi:hypothetical protein